MGVHSTIEKTRSEALQELRAWLAFELRNEATPTNEELARMMDVLHDRHFENVRVRDDGTCPHGWNWDHCPDCCH